MNQATPMSDRAQDAHYIETWADTLGRVLKEISGSPFPFVVLPEIPTELSALGSTDIVLVASLAGALRGEMSLRMPPKSVVRLAQLFMGEPASSGGEVTADYRDAVVELFRQAGGLIATTFGKDRGEIQITINLSQTLPSWTSSSTAWLQGGGADGAAWIEMQISAALAAALRAENVQTTQAAPSASETSAQHTNLDALMDVQLAATLRFGSRRLLLSEILDFGPGAVIELDRQIQEPVDLLLENRVLARGELVVLDGNYGLRVTEVAPRT